MRETEAPVSCRSLIPNKYLQYSVYVFIPIGSMFDPFYGLYLESYKDIPKRNY